nr:riboflavin synthase [Candidatus Gracilibacteria bacterium]
MFSGIIEKKSKILSINAGKFTIENTFSDLNEGQSIAHDGACMTLTKIDSKSYTFFTMEESLKRTNFGNKKIGDYFNVERCVKYGDRIDGHFVTGHIDTTGIVNKVENKSDDSRVIFIKFDNKFNNLIIEKGSIAVNGASLTLVDVGNDFFSISLIPYTLEHTNLGDLKVGDIVNLEFDMLGKYVNKIKSL